ncbi:MAG: TetR/AcrR family transcriptional regulator [Cyanobacteria bacterium P01_G01_bin.38]
MTEKSSGAIVRKWRKPKQARSLERVNRILDVAEAIFVEQGYAAATTKEIAAVAKVPIGTLYQFFPDKEAILQALAERYTDLLNQQLQSFETEAILALPLSEYVRQLIEGINTFFTKNPGYRAVFVEITTIMPETEEAGDQQFIQTLAGILPKLNSAFSPEDCDAIAFVLVKAVGNLLWIASGQTPAFRQRLVQETQQLAINYLQSYFP